MKADPSLLAKVRQFLRALDTADAGIVVAVSGGPDSVALLRALLICCEDTPLVVAHLNHQLRGPESDGDEEFVRDLFSCVAKDRQGTQLRCQRTNVSSQADASGENLESTARRLRYEWLANVAKETKCRWVATGHTADDQAETVLHRLLRGSGLQGLRGIAARRPLADRAEIIRPLFHVTRAEVVSFLNELNQAFRQDSSNANTALTRNRIRHELLPLLKSEYNPALVPSLTQLAQQAEELFAIIAPLAEKLLVEAELPRAGSLLIFNREHLLLAPRYLVREVFRQAWGRERWPMGEMSFADWERLATVAVNAGGAVDLPGGIRARCRGRVVQLGPSM